ncbi:MAG: cytochrome-c peroxidase [Verrucomicrobiota bacterium]
MKTLIPIYCLFTVAAMTDVLAQGGAPVGVDPAKIGEIRAKAKEVTGALPAAMPGAENDTAALVDLGRKLFFEKKLSMNQSQSCNSCHAVDAKRAGVDGEPTSPGAFGKRGGRNSPTVLNAGFHFAQFWDGRAATLEDQAKGPILNPVEMAMPDEKVVLERLRADKDYPGLFSKAFSAGGETVSYDRVAKAIAAFERTLVTHDRFDDFLNGNDKALTASEIKGLELFMEVGCTTCHNGPLIGANTFQKMGLIQPYANTTDLGRFDVTKDESDKFKFKVPSLRNVALTGPFFHDGRTSQLDQAVTQMARLQLGRELAPAEKNALLAFLRSLSDKERAAVARN